MNFQFDDNRISYRNEQGERTAYIAFEDDGKNVVVHSTFVDPSLRGEGIADEMTAVLLEKIKEEGKTITPICSYTAHWLKKHPEFTSLIVE